MSKEQRWIVVSGEKRITDGLFAVNKVYPPSGVERCVSLTRSDLRGRSKLYHRRVVYNEKPHFLQHICSF